MKKNNLNLSSFNNVFCDSISALDWAFKNGLSKNVLVRTSSPNLIANKNINSINLEEKWTPGKIEKFQVSASKTCRSVYKKLLKTKRFSESELLMVNSQFLKALMHVYKGSCLVKKDLLEPRALISFSSKFSCDKFIYPSWLQLLDSNQSFKSFNAEIKIPNFIGLSTKDTSFLKRLYIGGSKTLIYMIGIKFQKLISKFGIGGKHGLIFKPHELIKETVASLFFKGYTFEEFTSKYLFSEMYNEINYEIDELDDLLDEFINIWIDPIYSLKCRNIIKNKICEGLNDLNKLTKVMSNDKIFERVSFILAGSMMNIYGRSLSEVATKRGIPIVSFSHGITHEIANYPAIYSSHWESSFADLTIAHTDKGASTILNQPYCRSKAKVFGIGLTSRTFRLNNLFYRENTDVPILYLSTNLQNGNETTPLCNQENEWEKDKRETKTIKILSRIPHFVAYKPYPEETRKFIDPSLTIKAIEKSKNISIAGQNLDARFLIGNYEILILPGATSTLGWIFPSGKPIIFINWSNHLSLSAEAKPLFRKGLFYFEGDDKNFEKKLVIFLSQSIKEIKLKWKEKREDRKLLMSKYISKNITNVGNKTAIKIISFLENFNKD